MTENAGKFALILNTAAYDRVAFSLSLAIMTAAVGKDVGVLFGYGALARLKKGAADELGEETEAWIRPQVKDGIDRGSVQRISEALETLTKLGGKLYACPAAMALHHIGKAELIEEASTVCSVADFLNKYPGESSTTLYV